MGGATILGFAIAVAAPACVFAAASALVIGPGLSFLRAAARMLAVSRSGAATEIAAGFAATAAAGLALGTGAALSTAAALSTGAAGAPTWPARAIAIIS